MENKIIIYQNKYLEIFTENNNTGNFLYINIINGNYDKKNFQELIEYYKNFWLLINNSDDKYYQIFLFNNINIYPLEFYTSIVNTLISLEEIYKKNLIASCLINNSNAIDIFKPILNIYKSVKPFTFVKNLEDGYKFLKQYN